MVLLAISINIASGGKEYHSSQTVGESVEISANSPTIPVKTKDALHGRFMKRPYDRSHCFRLFSQPLFFNSELFFIPTGR